MPEMVMNTVQLKRIPFTGGRFLAALLNRANDGADLIHKKWMSIKSIEKIDPTHPFQGIAPEGSEFEKLPRVRVSSLTREQIAALNSSLGTRLEFDPDDSRDVFHALFRPQTELVQTNPRVAGKNRVPVIAILQALFDEFGEESTLEEIEVNLRAVKVNRSTNGKRIREKLCRAVHAGWMTGETTHGEDSSNNPDFKLFEDLSKEKQSYDDEVLIVVIDWVLEEASKYHTSK